VRNVTGGGCKKVSVTVTCSIVQGHANCTGISDGSEKNVIGTENGK
jgi:hypothetical protein